MKIISVAHRASDRDFAFAVVNDDKARAFFAQLKRADTKGLFTISEFTPDSEKDLLNYIVSEQTDSKVF